MDVTHGSNKGISCIFWTSCWFLVSPHCCKACKYRASKLTKARLSAEFRQLWKPYESPVQLWIYSSWCSTPELAKKYSRLHQHGGWVTNGVVCDHI